MILLPLALLLGSVFSHSLNPPVRQYDFISPYISPSPSEISLSFFIWNVTYTLKLERNEYLIHADSVLKVHDPLTGKISTSSIVSHPYHGKAYVGQEEVGSARILFRSE
jgi:hypothetical protein